MEIEDVVYRDLSSRALKSDVLVVQDYQHLLEFPDKYTLAGKNYRVIAGEGNLQFRMEYEPLRDQKGPFLFHITNKDVFVPDVMSLAGVKEAVCEVTPQGLVQKGTRDKNISSHFNEYPDLVKDYFAHIIKYCKALKRRDSGVFSDSDVREILTSAVLDVEMTDSPEIVELWSAWYRNSLGVEKLLSLPLLAESLREKIGALALPFRLLMSSEPESLSRFVWTTFLLSRHIKNPVEMVALFDQNYFSFKDSQLAEISQLCTSLWATDPELAKRQLSDAESALTEDNLESLTTKLSLKDIKRAFNLATEEDLSPRLLVQALRFVLLELPVSRARLPEKAVARLRDHLNSEKISQLTRRDHNWALDSYIELFLDLTRLDEILVDVESFEEHFNIEDLLDLFINRACFIDLLCARLERSLRKKITSFNDLTEESHQEFYARFSERILRKVKAAEEAMNKLNVAFAGIVKEQYPDWVNKGSRLLTAGFLKDFFKPIKGDRKEKQVYLLIFDGMRWDAWEEFVKPLLERRFEIKSVMPMLSILPSSTQFSRKAIFAGRFPEEFDTRQSESRLIEAVFPEKKFKSQIVVEDESEDAIISLRMVCGDIQVIVFNFCDQVAHKVEWDLAYLYQTHIRSLTEEDVPPEINKIPQDAVVFVTSDHGIIELGSKYDSEATKVTTDSKDIQYRYFPATSDIEIGSCVCFTAGEARLPKEKTYYQSNGKETRKSQPFFCFETQNRYFKRPGGKKARFAHGGISLQEMVVPAAWMISKKVPLVKDVEVVGYAVEDAYNENQEGKITVTLQLVGSKLFETAFVCIDELGQKSVPVELDAGKSKEVELKYLPKLPSDIEYSEPVEQRIKVSVKYRDDRGKEVAKHKFIKIRVKPESGLKRIDILGLKKHETD